MFVTTILPKADVSYIDYRKMSVIVPIFENFVHCGHHRDEGDLRGLMRNLLRLSPACRCA